MKSSILHATCLRLLRDPRLLQALEDLSHDPSGVSREQAEILADGGLCNLTPPRAALTRLGRGVSYHLAEYRRQIEGGAAETYISRLDVRHDSRVLDVGCGAGQSLVALLRERPRLGVGLEFDATALAVFTAISEFEGLRGAHPVRGNAEMLPFADGSFDRILCRVVLMHVRVLPTLAEIARVSAAGALVYLHLTDFWFYWRKFLRRQWEKGGVPFALLNGLLLQFLGLQVRIGATRSMNYQSLVAVRRWLIRHGFEIVGIEEDREHRRLQPKILARRC